MATSSMMKAFAVMCGAIAALVTATGAAGWAINAYRQSSFGMEREFDELMRTEPVMQAFAASYPQEFQAFRDGMIVQITEHSATREDVRRAAFDWSRAFMLERMDALAAAPDAELAAVITADGEVLRYFQATNIGVCAEHAMVGIGASTTLPPGSEDYLSRATVARIRAARAGEDNPIPRPDPSPADVAALEAAMRSAGMTERAVSGMLGGTILAAQPAQQCDATVGLFDGLEALPIAQSGPIYAFILRNAPDSAPS